MENVTLICENCGEVFERACKEHKRNTKRGRRTYCSLSCHAVVRNQEHSTGNTNNLRKGSEVDDLSPFRVFQKRVRGRNRRDGVKDELDLEFLKNLWDKQGGKCPYLKIPMKLTRDTGCNSDSLYAASLDRIDSSIGYKKDNVEYVCLFINYAKNRFPKEQVKDLLQQFKSS